LLFTNTTSLTYNLWTVSLFIQTDRSSYKPGDTVNVRVVTFQLDNKPYKGRVDISLLDPSGKPVESWNSTGNLGIALKEFSLSLMSRPGQWMIAATVNYRPTPFRSMGQPSFSSAEINFRLCTPSYQLATAMFYTLLSSLKVAPQVCFILNNSFNISALYHNIFVSVAVAPGFTVNKTVEVHVLRNKFQLMFLNFPSTLKPSLNFSTNRSSLMNSTTTSLTFSVPENGNVLIRFKLQDQVEMLLIQVSIMSHSSQKYSRSSRKSTILSFFASNMSGFSTISSKGQVVAAGTKNFSSSVTLTPELSWYPEACVTVYYNHSDGEITSDTAYISIHQMFTCSFQVTLNWSSERARPGEQVSLSVAGSESRFQVGITVTAMQNDDLQSGSVDLDYRIEQVVEHFGLEKKSKFNFYDDQRKILFEKPRRWTWKHGKITVPNGVTLLQYKPVLLPNLLLWEEVILEVNVINHLEQEIEFVLMDQRGASIINAQKITLRSHESASALFPIRPLALGEMEISVDAVSAEASDGLVEKIWVKPEGVEQTFSHTLFLEMTPEKQDSSRSVTFSFPPNLVPGSQRAHVALVGDILALSIENLDSLVQLPTGSGEQNMVHFAPSVFVLQYLEKSGQDDEGIRNKALRYMMQGYEKQLSYQRDDGSFSVIIWLTALVLRYFLQAQPYMQIDQTVLTKATAWLLKHQDSQGAFTEVGKLIHTEMREGQDDSPVALTAYVLLEMYANNVSLSLRYLESKVSSGIVSNYTLCLVAYALALGKSVVLETVMAELTRRADYRGESECLRSNNQQQHSTQIEMASYVLLVQFLLGSFIESIPLMKWLSMQRSYLGGFGTTQDTVVALQVLSYYAAFSGANAINLVVNISSPMSSTASLFLINSTNYRVYQSREINAAEDLPLNISMEGIGFAIFQVNIFYNTKSTQDIELTTDKDAFILNVDLTHNDSNHIMLSVCTRLKDNQEIAHTGMAILEVGMLSGFSLFSGAAVQADFIRRVDIGPERVSLYLNSVSF
uniref:Alpha-2-macroglobulin bait region domain-containing protein n=1 Tax=Xiphophorus couchianus TaxID=32473 RepID=A0A3B5LTQ3_9TELE